MTSYSVEIFGQKRTVQVWNYVSIMLGVGFVGGPPIGQWFTTQIVGKYQKLISFGRDRNLISQFEIVIWLFCSEVTKWKM